MSATGSALAFRQLPVNPDDGLPQRFSVAIGARAYDIVVYANLFLGRVDTSATSEVIGGQTVPQAVTPGSMKGITVGTVLAVGGPSDREIVAVSQVTGARFGAIFKNSHGPWPYAIRSAFHEQDPPETLYDLAGPAGLDVPVSGSMTSRSLPQSTSKASPGRCTISGTTRR